MPFPSGLSALIEAAASQLRDIDHEVADLPDSSARAVTVSHSEETASSDGDQRVDAVAHTPTMVPEPDLRRQSLPELLMTLALDPSNADTIAFLPDGKFFAIRAKEFADDLMIQYFAVPTFDEFLDLIQDWGFSRVLRDDNCSGIEVFRHPLFIRGNWSKCTHMRFGESPTEVRLSALPDRAKIDYGWSDDSMNSTSAHTKRRLSPGFLARRESETSVSSQKQKVEFAELETKSSMIRRNSCESSDGGDSQCPASHFHVSRTDDLRSIALSITTEKLQINTIPKTETNQLPLVQRAVESTTHTIVTDAIETLLRDEVHSKRTFRKHEKVLSRSSLPGVVPLTAQLFSSKDDDHEEIPSKNPQLDVSSSQDLDIAEAASAQSKDSKAQCRSGALANHVAR